MYKALKAIFIIIGFLTIFLIFGVCGTIETVEKISATTKIEYIACFVLLLACGIGFMAVEYLESNPKSDRKDLGDLGKKNTPGRQTKGQR